MTNFNPGTELAKERNRAAEERTLMAWIRTSLSLISFGFGISSIIAILNQELGGALDPFRASRILGLGFVALGTVSMLYAAMDHRRQIRRIERNELRYIPRISPTLVVAYVLAVLGGLAFLSLLIGSRLVQYPQ
ncbi:MAG: YidH family protein [Leptolyngbyaceae cyanobacterium]